jgi:hypothetical protein
VQAGLLAGMAVAAFFFVADLVRLAPLYTPLHLSQSLIGAGLSLDTGGVLAAAAGFSPGGRLAAFTGVYLAAFAGFGILAAALANLFHVKWNARTGAAAGLLSGLTAWFAASRAGAAWIDAAHLTPELVIGAGIVGGAVLGWHLRLCRLDAEEAR